MAVLCVVLPLSPFKPCVLHVQWTGMAAKMGLVGAGRGIYSRGVMHPEAHSVTHLAPLIAYYNIELLAQTS